MQMVEVQLLCLKATWNSVKRLILKPVNGLHFQSWTKLDVKQLYSLETTFCMLSKVIKEQDTQPKKQKSY